MKEMFPWDPRYILLGIIPSHLICPCGHSGSVIVRNFGTKPLLWNRKTSCDNVQGNYLFINKELIKASGLIIVFISPIFDNIQLSLKGKLLCWLWTRETNPGHKDLKCQTLKVSKFRKQIMVSKLLPKNKTNSLSWKITTSRLIQKESLCSFCKKIYSLLY